MKARLKDFQENQYKPSWIALLMIAATFVFNSYLILYFIIPFFELREFESITNGYINSTFVAYLLSLIFYLSILRINGIKPKSLIKMQNAKASILVGVFLIGFFLIIQLPYISFEKLHTMSSGYLLGFLAELVIAAGVEEVIFRAFLLSSLIYLFKNLELGNISVWLAVIFSSVLFSLSHLPYHLKYGTINFDFYIMAMLIGILLSWTYIWFSNLILVLLLHLLFNITTLYLPLETGGKGLSILLWFVVMTILSVFGFNIKRYINTKANSPKKIVKAGLVV